jgi:DNA-binding response OmpR family regulator
MTRIRAVLIAAGVLGMAYAVLGALTDPDVQPLGVLVFLAASLIAHDLIWMPLALLAGAVIARFGSPRRRGVVRAAMISAATVTVVAAPLILGPGRSAGNPSALPLDYGRHLVVVLALLAVAAVLAGQIGRLRRKKTERPHQHGRPPVLGSVDDVEHQVLVVDDDPTVSDVVRRYLEQAGCRVRLAGDGAAALAAVAAEQPDIVVLDLMMPGIDGLEVCRRLRHDLPDLPVVMLTALGEETDRVLGLEVGADDYVTKPFSPRELVLRIRSVLRRTTGPAPDPAVPAVLTDGGLTTDTARRIARLDGTDVSLTVREFDLLAFFLRQPGRVWSRTELLEKVWGWQIGDQSTVTVHVRRLREKIEKDPAEPRRILTVWGVGYRYEPVGEVAAG